MKRVMFFAGDDRCVKKLDESEPPLVTHAGKLIFRSGEGVDTQSVPKTPAQLSSEIYQNMLLLKPMYQDLTQFSNPDIIEPLLDELDVLTFAMRNIAGNLNRNLPLQTQRRVYFDSLCDGIRKTTRLLDEILADIRRLLRVNEDENIDIQLIIIHISLQEQRKTIQDLGEC